MSTSLLMHSRHIERSCPVCGCPLHIGVHLFGQTVTCGHCRGRFTASDSDDLSGGLTGRVDSLCCCADRVLRQPPGEPRRARFLEAGRGRDQVCAGVPSAASGAVAERETACMTTGSPVRRIKSILLVEYRDEVCARLSADLAEAGFRVERVCTAHGVRRHFARHRSELVIANMDTPDESGWLMASKLRLGSPATRISLYAPRFPSPVDQHFARFLAVELVHYPGDLISLAANVLCRVLEPAGKNAARESEALGGSGEPSAKAG